MSIGKFYTNFWLLWFIFKLSFKIAFISYNFSSMFWKRTRKLRFWCGVFDVASVLSVNFVTSLSAIYCACPVLCSRQLSQLGRFSLLASSMRVPAWVPISKNVSVNTFSALLKNNPLHFKEKISIIWTFWEFQFSYFCNVTLADFCESPFDTFIPLHSWLLRNCSIDAVVTNLKCAISNLKSVKRRISSKIILRIVDNRLMTNICS